VRSSIACLVILFALCQSAAAQIELSYTVAKSLVGTTSPRIVGERILIGDDSKPQFSQVAVIQAKASEPYRLKARRSLFEVAELISLGSDEYLLVGEGEYLVEAVSLNHERSLKVKIGGSPTPTPDPPKPPVPPKPDPVPDVANDYNVGVVALTKAPNDVPIAKQLATSYRTNAAKLFGQGGLADVQTILNQIAKDFSAKQCRDVATCQQWDAWRVAVQAAMSGEQTKRKTFTRQDWYGCLMEVANALDFVK
jgi:hypothetical protein